MCVCFRSNDNTKDILQIIVLLVAVSCRDSMLRCAIRSNLIIYCDFICFNIHCFTINVYFDSA